MIEAPSSWEEKPGLFYDSSTAATRQFSANHTTAWNRRGAGHRPDRLNDRGGRLMPPIQRPSPSQTTMVDPLTEPTDAEMMAKPSWYEWGAWQLTSPADTVATLGVLEVQFAVAVTFLVAPDAKNPVAVS